MLEQFKDKAIYFVTDVDLDGTSGRIVFDFFINPIAGNTITYATGERDLPEFNWILAKAADIVLFCDIAPPDVEFLERIQETTRCIICDHHVTSRMALGDYEDYYYTNEKCGCKILFDLVRPKRVKQSIFQYIELVDIYDRWQDTNGLFDTSHDIHNAMYASIDWGMKNLQTETEKFDNFVTRQLFKIYKYDNFFLDENEQRAAKRARDKEKDNYKQAKKSINFRTDNSNNKYAYFSCTSKVSWVCHLILKEYTDIDYVVCFSTWDKGALKMSMRSKKAPINYIAEKWGGGGHPNASGFEFKDKRDFDDFIIGKLHLI